MLRAENGLIRKDEFFMDEEKVTTEEIAEVTLENLSNNKGDD